MVVECGFNMAASNTLSTVNGHAVQRRSGGGGGGGGCGGSSSSSACGVGQSSAVLSFQCQSLQSQGEREHHQDSARLHSNGNCGDSKQCRAEFLSAKDANRRKRVSFFLLFWFP